MKLLLYLKEIYKKKQMQDTHTHKHVKTCHDHTAAAFVFWWQIRFAVMKGSRRIREESAESSLVTIQQPRTHLHLAIWMSSDSVAGYCTSLNSSSLDNSRWLSRVKLAPIHSWVTAGWPDHSDKSETSKLGYKCGGLSYLWQQRTRWTTLNILCEFRSNN